MSFSSKRSERVVGRGPRATLALALAIVASLSSCADVLGISAGTPRAGAGGAVTSGGAAAGEAGAESGQGGTTTAAAGHGGSTIGDAGNAESSGGAGSGGAADTGDAGDAPAGDAGLGGAPATGGSQAAGAGGEAGKPVAECEPDQRRCDGNVPLTCVDGVFRPGTLCQSYCAGGYCQNPPSCNALDACRDQTSCCRALVVEGGTFTRDFDRVDYVDETYRATVSPFLLDEFEVTIGRFRNFVKAYASIELEEHAGRGYRIQGDPGWRASYPLPASSDELEDALASEPGCLWTRDATGNEQRPMNCVNFFLAYAFCIWDGGRLPTEAEWNFAAAGGDEQRAYPWSDPPGDATITPDDASYYPEETLLPVGSKSGDGRWGHADLAGSVFEWTLDYYVAPYPSTQCRDCLVATGATSRSVRGGAYNFEPDDARVARRNDLAESAVRDSVGFRCVHDIIEPDTNGVTE